MPPARQTIAGSRYFHETSAERPFPHSRSRMPDLPEIPCWYCERTLFAGSAEYHTEKVIPTPSRKECSRKTFSSISGTACPGRIPVFSGCCGIRIYKAVDPAVNIHFPLSNVRRFTWSSLPRIISIPCSVSSRISADQRKGRHLPHSRYMSVCWSWSLYAYVLSRLNLPFSP